MKATKAVSATVTAKRNEKGRLQERIAQKAASVKSDMPPIQTLQPRIFTGTLPTPKIYEENGKKYVTGLIVVKGSVSRRLECNRSS